jgi:hypothetical protein
MDEMNMIFKATKRLTRKTKGSLAVMCRKLILKSLDAEESREVVVRPSHTVLSKPSAMTFELVARPVPMDPGASSLCCPECQIPLDLHQPDEDRPSQLIGTCEWCSKWYFLVEIDPDWNGSLLFELPCVEDIRAMLAVPSAAN